jgi:hypothetical protein
MVHPSKPRSDLKQLISSVRNNLSERELEEQLIKPLLQILGYTVEDWQSQVSFGKKRVDFLVSVDKVCTHAALFDY